MLSFLTEIPTKMLLGADDFDEGEFARPAWAPDADTYVLIPDPPPPPRIDDK